MEYKLLVANLDSLWKHAGRHKTLVAMPRVKVGGHYFLKPNAHVPNEKLYFAKGLKTMLQHVIHGAISIYLVTTALNRIHNNVNIICATKYV
jgi:hypothetical protein